MNEDIRPIPMRETEYKKLVEPYEEEALRTLSEIVAIPSVHDEEHKSEQHPFGPGVEEALAYMAKKGEELGFMVDRCDNYVTELSYGEGEKILDIYAHLDVVPVKREDWIHDPFRLTIDDGIMYGRGSADDKGPGVACLYAVKALMDAGRLGGCKLRFIFGGNEERDSLCLDHYFHVLKKGYPDMGFSPDADYPLIYAEKSIYAYSASYPVTIRNVSPFELGDALNVVMAQASCQIDEDEKKIDELIKRYEADHDDRLSITREGKKLTFRGVPYHGSMPYNGVSAGLHLLNFLGALDDCQVLKDIYQQYIDGRGDGFRGNFRDENFDCSTYNVGGISYDGKNLTIFVNARFPSSLSKEEVISNVEKNTGAEVKLLGGSDGFVADPQSALVTTLMSAYSEETGDDESKPLAIGGGTYARESKNSVAFGAQFLGRDYKMHGDDEFFPLSDFYANMQIYAHGVDALCTYLRELKR